MKKIKNSLMKNVSLAVATICTVQFSVTGIASAQVATPKPIEAYSMVASTTGLKASVGSVNVTIGDTETIHLTYNGSPIDNALVDWEIGSSSIASVNNGVVYGKKVGTTVVTARYNGYRATVRVTVDRAQTLEATKTEVSVKKGKKTNVSLKFAGSSLPGSRATWKTADKTVATVDDGEIKGVGEGSTVITASYKDQEVEIRVDVEGGNSDGKLEADVTKLKMEKGDKETIKLTYDDDKLSGSKATWKTSKSSVATVNDDGVVTAKGKGTATITAKYKGYEVEVEVYVDTDSSGKLEADETSLSLKKGDRDTIQLTYDDERLSGSKATWKTSNSSVATVDDGVVTAKGQGTATITASYKGDKVEIRVKVDYNNSGKLEVNDSTISLKKGERETLTLKYDGSTISNSSASWSTSRSSVATVSSSGTITATGKGKATITAQYKGEKVEIEVTVDGSSSGSLEADDTDITLKKGERETVKLRYDGDTISNSKASWKTSKSSVATVSSSGTITAKGKGTATITATYKGEKVEIEVKVDSKGSSKLEADDTSITLKKGDSEKIKLTYDGDDISSSKAKWKSSKSSVASVSSSGTVKGKKKGKATITAEYKGYEVEIEVTVK
ncbi:Ig-like domain-containing protein [Brevibacillus formosus]|uniref:Ig-like domain-containing protein n=1 Tax=Brevibacillus TaxID=55080 RepID=UPI000D0F0066|nr:MULTISPECIES: Ig-like domain-containing protein [Brevibacillus]MBG9945067.1 Ig-like domain-containing surface protein [Brevibacillus formosus]MED1947593.1 Ig-like domain-containing protein [Brevibacillus formosus]MED1997140.1 Ig-like domain-containing protein [Brevibacillus formosus]MED2082997.1 Ig-like domain-containing protein [Brevibacillus formosus]PSK20035.1 Ig-like domain-containing surface protein [Brevibacillus sp. NRRL NRS-603]